MKQPDIILSSGLKVKTQDKLKPEALNGICIAKRHLANRDTNSVGVIKGVVAGCGGDIYWVEHGNAMAVYGWWEFDRV